MPDALFPCSMCHALKPLIAFNKDKKNKDRDGHSHQCKACINARSKRYYARKKATRRVQIAAWKIANPEKVLAYDRKFKSLHKDEIHARRAAKQAITNAKERAKYRLNPAPTILRTTKYHREHPDLHNRWSNAWHRKHPELARARCLRRAAKKKALAINDLSAAQIVELIAAKNSRCDYCGRKTKRLEVEHITPVTKGGNHTLWNVTVACRSCNAKKGTKAPLNPVQPLLLTIAPARKKKAS